MNQQICLKRVQKQNEKKEAKQLNKLKKARLSEKLKAGEAVLLEDDVAQSDRESLQNGDIKIKMPFVFVRAAQSNKFGEKTVLFNGKSFSWKI